MAVHGFERIFKAKIKINDFVLGAGTQSQRSVYAASTTAALPNAGIISLSTMSTSAGNPWLSAPYAGAQLLIYTTAASTGFKVEGSTGTSVLIGPSTNVSILFGSSTAAVVNCGIDLVGISTAAWAVAGTFGTVAYATA